MKNWLIGIYDRIRLYLTEDTDLSPNNKVRPLDKAIVRQETGIATSPIDTTENRKSSPVKNKPEDKFLFESFKNMTPVYLLIVAEMRKLLNSDKKIVFQALTTGLSIDEVATHLALPGEEVKRIYREALQDIHIQSGFVRNYINDNILKEQEISNLKLKIRILKHELSGSKNTVRYPVVAPIIHQAPGPEQKALLAKPLVRILDLDIRILHVLKYKELNTLEDLLRFAMENGLDALKQQRNFGHKSFKKLEGELIKKKIFDNDGYCELYKYITPRQG